MAFFFLKIGLDKQAIAEGTSSINFMLCGIDITPGLDGISSKHCQTL